MHTTIGIVGAGMGGLVLARVLRRHGVEATVFERDAGPQARWQGGSLDLHPDAGQRALELADLSREFWAQARPEGADATVLDPTGRVLVRLSPDPDEAAARPEIDRPQLRSLLLSAVGADQVRWGSELVGTSPRDGGGWDLSFADGSGASCELLVGADGARSRVRPLCADVTLEFRYAYVELAITDADQTAPEVAAMVGPGSYRVLGDDLNLMAQRNGDGSIRVSVSARGDEDWAQVHGVDEHDPVATKSRLRELFDGWEPSLLALFDATDDHVTYRPVWAGPPTEIGWPTRRDVTLLGDAAHLMAPTGDGANHAMLDGALLGTSIAGALAAGRPLADAVRDYESEMFVRTSAVAAHSRRMEEVGISPNAAERLAQFLATSGDAH